MSLHLDLQSSLQIESYFLSVLNLPTCLSIEETQVEASTLTLLAFQVLHVRPDASIEVVGNLGTSNLSSMIEASNTSGEIDSVDKKHSSRKDLNF